MTKGNHDHCIRKLIKTGYWTSSVLHYFTLNLNFDLAWNSEEVHYPVFTNFLIQWWIHSCEGRGWQQWLAVVNWLVTRLTWLKKTVSFLAKWIILRRVFSNLIYWFFIKEVLYKKCCALWRPLHDNIHLHSRTTLALSATIGIQSP